MNRDTDLLGRVRVPDRRRSRARGGALLSSFLVLLLVTAGTVPALGAEGVTVRRVVDGPKDVFSSAVELVRLSLDPQAGDGALTLTWRPVPGGFFPTWYFFLESEIGLTAPEGVRLGPVTPVAGRRYEVGLSYDYTTGLVALHVADGADGKTMYQGTVTVAASDRALHPADAMGAVTSHSRYVPLATRWDVVAATGTGGVLPVRHLDRSVPHFIRVNTRTPEHGELLLVVEGADEKATYGRTELRLGPVVQGEGLYDLDLSRLPVGPVTARLEYWADGVRVWESDSVSWLVGRLEATLGGVVVDTEGRTLHLSLEMRTDGPLPGVDVHWQVVVTGVGWDAATQSVTDVADSVSAGTWRFETEEGGTAQLDLRIPFAGVRPLLRAELVLAVEPEIGTTLRTGGILFSPASGEAVMAGSAGPISGSRLAPTQNWESEIAAIEARYAGFDLSRGAVVFIGSSSIRGWRTLETDFPELPVINAGFGGSQIIDSVYYVDRLVYPFRPHTVVMYAGSNDINAGKSPTQVFADYVAFVEAVHRELPQTRIIYISIAPSPSRWAQRNNVMQANRLIAMYAAGDPRLDFVDVYHLMLGEDGTPQPHLYLGDQLHMTPAGYAIWTRVVRPYLGLE